MVAVWAFVKSRAWEWALAIGAVLAVLLYVFKKGEKVGETEIKAEVAKAKAKQEERIDAVEKEYARIDAGRPDFDGAVGRLRDRARKPAGGSSLSDVKRSTGKRG